MARVANKRVDRDIEDAVYIGRPSKWGNPFVIGKDGTREQVVAKYEKWLMAQPALVEAARRELKGRTLMCFCSPAPCHGDVLLRVANGSVGGSGA